MAFGRHERWKFLLIAAHVKPLVRGGWASISFTDAE